MKKIILFVFLIGFYCDSVLAQDRSTIAWKTWLELEISITKEPKPIVLFFYSDWCAYCKKIEREVFTKQTLVEKINTEYYALKMNVNSQDTIHFDNSVFYNKQASQKQNGIHELPLLLASRKNSAFSVPVTLLLDKNFLVKKRVFTYYTSNQFLSFLE